jgi:hypothetical protein
MATKARRLLRMGRTGIDTADVENINDNSGYVSLESRCI